MPANSHGFVYLIEAQVGTNAFIYKIGRTIDIKQRMNGLSTMSPVPLKLMCLLQTVCMQRLEQELHKKYASERVHGEWFRLTVEQVYEVMQHPLSDKCKPELVEAKAFIEDMMEAINKCSL